MRHRSHPCASPRRQTQEGGWTPRSQAQGPKRLWPLTLEALHSLPIHVLVAEADERFLDGSLRPKRLGGRSGAGGAGPGGRSAGLAPPHRPLYLAVPHQAGHGLLSISTGLGRPEGAQGGHPRLLSPPTPLPGRVWRVQRALAWGALSREACFRATEDGLARGCGEGRKGTHRVWGFRK